MKSLNYIWAGILLAAAAPELSAQNAQYIFEGEVMQQASLSAEAAARLTQPQLFGTARSAAMANAFTSLGADMASLSINPAGLGMYRHSELSLTPLVTSSSSSNSGADYGGNSKTRFALGNLGMVYNLYEGTGRVVSVNLGIGYNRVADLNYRTSFQNKGAAGSSSILDLMAGQLTVNELYPYSGGFQGHYGEYYPDLWGAMMASVAQLIKGYSDEQGPFWEANVLGENARIGRFYDLESRGSVGEYDLSFGMNIDNRFYVGATFGIQSLSQRIDLYYGEEYGYDGPAQLPGEFQANYMHYNQAVEMTGVGVNFKLGLIYRPIEALRIGFAFHSPTYWSIDHAYAGQMASRIRNNGVAENDPDRYSYYDRDTEGSWTDSGSDSYRLTAPSRLMFGASYAFGSRAVVSVDYERDWYNGVRTTQYPFWVPDPSMYHRSAFKQKLCATNTLRLGAEFKPIDRLALRAGFSYTSSMVRNSELTQSTPVADRIIYYTAGMGFALSRRVTLDVAYQYCRTENSDYRLFYSLYLPESGPAETIDTSELVSTDYTRHNALLTLNVKF